MNAVNAKNNFVDNRNEKAIVLRGSVLFIRVGRKGPKISNSIYRKDRKSISDCTLKKLFFFTHLQINKLQFNSG